MKHTPLVLIAAAVAAVLALASCGGGGSAGGDGSGAGSGPVTTAPTALSSSGSITAFGSVFVNGHEFAIGNADIIDDDAGTSQLPATALEVGMSVDVVAASASTTANPAAAEIHLHPLARGIVDASDPNASTLTVMGQSVQLTAATVFSDHRACLSAATPCAAVAGASDLAATSGSGSSATPGSYVAVYGYLYAAGSAGGTSAGGADIVATLIAVGDAPTSPTPVAYKAEGLVTAASGTALTIGGLSLDLSQASCYAGGAATPCTGAYASGQIVSAVGAVAPMLPATLFQPAAARLRPRLPVQTDGAPVELEGAVSTVTSSPAAFVLRGVAVDASALSSGSLPAVGDIVRVTGVVAAGGTSVAASAVSVIHPARSATYGFEGDAGTVTAGPASGSYVLTLLGQSITVDASTRLADRSARWGSPNPAGSPFNIATFQTYLAASASQHLLVSAQADGNGQLGAVAVTIVPASSVSGIEGSVDTSPAPVNGSAGAPTTFSVRGLAVSADPASVVGPGPFGVFGLFGHPPPSAQIAAGDRVIVLGSYSAGTFTVSAPIGIGNQVVDLGAPIGNQHDCF